MRRLLTLAALIVLSGACGADGGGPSVKLDGSARIPSDQGVVTAVSRSSLTLDSTRTYRLTPKLQSFSTSTLTVVSVLQRKGQYVQIGARGHTAGWVASVAAVLPTRPPAVYYEGTLARISQRRAFFRDGTVFQMAPELAAPTARGHFLARIDPSRRAIVELTPQAA